MSADSSAYTQALMEKMERIEPTPPIKVGSGGGCLRGGQGGKSNKMSNNTKILIGAASVLGIVAVAGLFIYCLQKNKNNGLPSWMAQAPSAPMVKEDEETGPYVQDVSEI